MEQQKYQLFDGEDATYELVVTSNANIRKVCKVMTQCHTLDKKDRVYYARHGDIKPEVNEDQTEATYNFKNRYDDVTLWPALAKVLFYDGPDLLETGEDGSVFVPEAKQQQFDRLIRSEVMRGRDDFLAKFGVNPPEVRNLFQSLASAQTPLTTKALMDAAEAQDPEQQNTAQTSKTGKTAS